MPTVPRLEGQQVQRDRLQLPDAQPENYGGGEIARAVGGLSEDLLKMRDEADALVLDEREAMAYDRVQQIEREATTLRGTEAVNAPDLVESRWGAAESEIYRGLSPRLQEQLRARMMRYRAQLDNSVSRHAYAEEGKAVLSITQARVKQLGDEAVRADRLGDPVAAAEAEANLRAQLQRLAQHTHSPYSSPEEAERVQVETLSSFHGQRITAILATPNPDVDAALRLYESVKDQLTGDLPQEIQRRLDDAKTGSEVQKAVNRLALITDPTDRAAALAAIGDVKVEQQVRAVLRQRDADTKDAQTAEKDATYQTLWEAVQDPANRGVPLETIAGRMNIPLGSLEAEKLSTLRRGADDRDDAPTWVAFMSLADSTTGVATLAKMDFGTAHSRYFSRMSESNASRALAIWSGFRRKADGTLADPNAARASTRLLSNAQLFEKAAERFGILPPITRTYTSERRNQDPAVQTAYNDFQLAAQEYISKLERAKGRELDAGEVQEEVLSFAAKRVMFDRDVRQGRGREDAGDAPAFGLTSDRIAALPPEERMRAYIPRAQWDAMPAVEGSVRETVDARNRYTSAGILNPTDFQIGQMIYALRFNDTDTMQSLLKGTR